jgi:dynein heavy chain
MDQITKILYTNISRGLFEKDKIIYSFLITTSIKRKANEIDEGVWNVLLRGPTVFTERERD